MRLAIFDIDGTLVSGASTEKRFFMYLLRSGKQGPRQLFAFVWFALRWLPNFGRHTLKKNKAYLVGMNPEDLRDWSDQWLASGLANAWVRPCLERLRWHQEKGDAIALVSGTPDFIAQAMGRHLGVSVVVGTVCAQRRGRFAARPPLCHPFGADKLPIFKQLADRFGLSLADVVAYGDSVHDMVVFRAVGKPVAVCPEPELATTAEHHGWEILCPAASPRLSLPRPFQAS